MANPDYHHLYDRRWRKARLAFLQNHPLCRMCGEEGRITVAGVVDHKIPHRGDLALFWDQSNWQPLCKPHHDRHKQSLERGGSVIGLDGWPLQLDGPGPQKVWGFSVPHGLEPATCPVTVVAGPPASGKTTYVRQHAAPDDRIIDLDDILERIGGVRYDTRPEFVKKALAYRDKMIRGLSEGRTNPAWLIITGSTKAERQAWLSALGDKAKLVVIYADPETCRQRIIADPARRAAAMRLVEVARAWER